MNHCEHVASYYWKRYTGDNTNAEYLRLYRLWASYANKACPHGDCV